MFLKGRAHTFGDNIDTDIIIPARYLNTTDPSELAIHCMEGIDPDFPKKVSSGDIIVAGENFGCGSSREHAPVSIKACGISCIIAKSFARIFYRNAFNLGLPLLESKEAPDNIETGDLVEVDLPGGKIVNITKGMAFSIKPIPSFMLELLEADGLMAYIKKKMG